MAEGQTSTVEGDQVTSEDVSKKMEDLGEVILVQRARVRSLTAKPLMAETEKWKLESLKSLLKDAIIAQTERYKKRGRPMRAGLGFIRLNTYKLEADHTFQSAKLLLII